MGDIIFKNEQRVGIVQDGRCLIGVMYEENFGKLLPYIRDIEVTDINWNGQDLWIDDVSRGRYNAGIKLEKEFIDAFCIRVANVVSRTFNKYYPKLEAETDDLRITILHSSRSDTGTIISIRKTPMVKRISFAKSIKEDYYCPEKIANLLSNSVKAKMNIVIGGLPGVGKTELIKYLTNYIFPRDRVITIEDTREIHYSKINPGKDCVEMKVDDVIFTYTDAIKTCMRLLPQWILLSEARSKEVQYLLESVSTGAKCITTIHTDDMRKVPKRVVNMLGDLDNSALAESMAYTYFDLGILVDKRQDPATGKISRFIAQVVMYTEVRGKNECVVLYNRGSFTDEPIPRDLLQQFNLMGIADPWKYTFIEDTRQDIDDSTGFLDDEGADDGMSVVDDTKGLTGNSTSKYMDEEDEASGEVSLNDSDESENSHDSGSYSKGVESSTSMESDVEKIQSYEIENEGTGFGGSDDAATDVVDETEEATDIVEEGDFSEEATGVVDESEEATGVVSENDFSEETTGVIEDDKGATDVVDEGLDASEEATGVVEDEVVADESEEATGVADDSDEGATVVVEEGERATDVVEGSEVATDMVGDEDVPTDEIDSEAPTGYVEISESESVSVEEVAKEGTKKRRGKKRGRR